MYDLAAPGARVLIDTRNQIAADKLAKGDKYVAQVFGDVQRPEESACGRALYKHMTELFASGDIKVRFCAVLQGGVDVLMCVCSPGRSRSYLAAWRASPTRWRGSRAASAR